MKTKTYCVRMTEEDFDPRYRKDGWRCPIANALNRCIPDGVRVGVRPRNHGMGTTVMHIGGAIQVKCSLTPKELYAFTSAFDRGDNPAPLPPFRVTVEWPDSMKVEP